MDPDSWLRSPWAANDYAMQPTFRCSVCVWQGGENDVLVDRCGCCCPACGAAAFLAPQDVLPPRAGEKKA
jgi:hypothetical protein